jgi:hypothetical protein
VPFTTRFTEYGVTGACLGIRLQELGEELNAGREVARVDLQVPERDLLVDVDVPDAVLDEAPRRHHLARHLRKKVKS